MIQIKNIKPSKLIISDAGIKLSPGQVVTVNSISPQTENLIAMGYVVKVEEVGQPLFVGGHQPKKTEDISVSVADEGTPAVDLKKYYSLNAADAIEFVSSVTDPQILRVILQEESRKKVIETINQRLAELEK